MSPFETAEAETTEAAEATKGPPPDGSPASGKAPGKNPEMTLPTGRASGAVAALPARILVVEDEQIVALEITDRLTRAGHQVSGVVASGQEAVDHVRRFHPDLVLMDLRLEGQMDGVEAAEIIHRETDTPIVYLTAFADEPTLTRAKRTEPYGYILKPFQEREFHVVIQVALYRALMARRLRESEAWRSSLLRSIGDAVIAVGPDGRVKFLNPLAETLTGWKEELAIGRPLDEVFKPLRVPERRAGGWTDAAYTSLAARDGSERPIEADDTPIRDATGATWGTVWTFRDISRRKWLQDQNAQLYAESRRAVQTREDVLAVVSHDLRSPLATISLTAEQMLRSPGKLSPQRVTDKLEAILCCARRMTRLIRDLLDVARIDGGRLSLELERAAPRDLIQDTVAMFEAPASERSIRIVRAEVPGPAVAVACDRERAIQVLANLLSNAVKFSRERGSIVLCAQQRGPMVQFSITDDGPGVGPDQVPHLFERYWQAPETARRGSGLGLYIAKGIVEAHRGRIWVDSAPGVGSTFHFTLPVAVQEEEQAVAPA